MDNNSEDETSYTTHYQEVFLKYVVNEYCDKHRRVPVNELESLLISNLVPDPMASRSCQSSFDPYDLSSDDEETLMPINVAETTPGQCNRTARLLTTTRLYLNSPPEAPKNWGQSNPNLNDYHSDPMEISSTFRLPDITDWWRQHKETHSKYRDLSNVAGDIFPIIPHGVAVEASSSLGQDAIGWRQSKPTGETLCDKVIVRQFARPNNRILVGDNPVSDTTNTENDSEMKKEVEKRKWHRMAKVHDFLEMWQGSQILLAMQKETRAQNKQRTAVGTFRTRKRSSKPCGHCSNMVVWLHLNCQKDHFCHQLCPQRTSLGNEHKSLMPAESKESTLIQSKTTRIAHLKVFWTPKIGSTGMATWIIQMTAKTIPQLMMNQIQSIIVALRIRNAQSSRM